MPFPFLLGPEWARSRPGPAPRWLPRPVASRFATIPVLQRVLVSVRRGRGWMASSTGGLIEGRLAPLNDSLLDPVAIIAWRPTPFLHQGC
ncbi:hypothetical protein VTN49DRAFT_3507 [Thermomyces lanuginosus]|uniref:uncharacterized protein n=1 Tax=Thermomyces lanuginosus TaxID=5541 RepID=UPI0037437102